MKGNQGSPALYSHNRLQHNAQQGQSYRKELSGFPAEPQAPEAVLRVSSTLPMYRSDESPGNTTAQHAL